MMMAVVAVRKRRALRSKNHRQLPS